MNPRDNWHSFVAKKEEQLRSYWLTRADFEAVIAEVISHPESPLTGLQFSLRFDAPFQQFDIGQALGTGADRRSIGLDDSRGGTCQLSWQLKPLAPPGAYVRHEPLAGLLTAWWKPELRTASAGLPDLKRNIRGHDIADATVAMELDRGNRPAILFCDLDDFGEVNKKFGQREGDRVIKEFASCAESAASRFGILLHNGGDEMVVLCPHGGALAAIRAAYAVRESVARHDFTVASLTVGMSAGLATTDGIDRIRTFNALLTESDDALHRFAKKPTKGRARFKQIEETSGIDAWPPTDFAALKKALVLSASSMYTPFGNAWLNALSAEVSEAGVNSGLGDRAVVDVASDFIAWMAAADGLAPTPEGHPPSFEPTWVSVNATAATLDLAFAIARGVIASSTRTAVGATISVRYSRDGHAAGVYLSNGTVLWSSSNAAELTEVCELPVPMQVTGADPYTPVTVPRAALVKIGHSPLPVPMHLFSEVIVVDDRPTRGGCLPDFWEVTIRRIVTLVHSDPNILALFVMGNHQHGAETVARLRELSQWDEQSEEISSRLSVTAEMVRATAKRLEGRVHYPGGWQELARILARELDAAPPRQALDEVSRHPRQLLNRPLRMDNMALHELDGCRVDTAAQAYPVVLEIVRKADISPIRDQAGRDVRELLDFKVHLTKPEYDMIPDYYSSQKERMQEYFQRAFLDETQFFGRALRLCGQLDAVLDHLAKVIQQDEMAFATRRAILVVPHEINDADELSPLGLVSVRIVPRFSGQRCELSYSFTWRTVEALVGFPYSLYGSVCFGQELTRLVRDRVSAATNERVTMGQISYIAHSLHMFIDESGLAIVRRIVNDATG